MEHLITTLFWTVILSGYSQEAPTVNTAKQSFKRMFADIKCVSHMKSYLKVYSANLLVPVNDFQSLPTASRFNFLHSREREGNATLCLRV